MQIFIWLMKGKQFIVEVKETDNLAALRDEIFKFTGVKQGEQRVIFKGKDYTAKSDDVSLSSLFIVEHSTIHIVQKVPGGIY